MTEKTTTGRLVAAVGGIVLIVSLFLTWFGVDIGGNFGSTEGLTGPAQEAMQNVQDSIEDNASQNAFGLLGFMPFVYLLIGVLALLPAVFDIFDLDLELPIENSIIAIVGGALALGGMLVLFDGPGGMKLGAWLALLASVAILVGGFLQVGDDDEYETVGAPAAAPVGYQPPPAAAPPAPQPPQPGPPPQGPPPPGAPPVA